MSNYRANMGRKAETDLARDLEQRGWIVGSRRHTGGAGDLLASKPAQVMVELPGQFGAAVIADVRLIEVKTTTAGPFSNFGPKDRDALRDCARHAGGSAWLAWRPYPSHGWKWFSEATWPARNGAK